MGRETGGAGEAFGVGRAMDGANQAAHRAPRTMDMGGALGVLRSGGSVTRYGWNGRNQRLMLQVPDAHSKMSLPYIYIVTVHGDKVPWLASQTDILAFDWVEVALVVEDR